MTSRPDFHKAGQASITVLAPLEQRVAKNGLQKPPMPFASACPGQPRSEAMVVLEAALELEPDLAEAVAWYLLVPIAEFGQMTASELVARGRGDAVRAFLRAIIEGRRG